MLRENRPLCWCCTPLTGLCFLRAVKCWQKAAVQRDYTYTSIWRADAAWISGQRARVSAAACTAQLQHAQRSCSVWLNRSAFDSCTIYTFFHIMGIKNLESMSIRILLHSEIYVKTNDFNVFILYLLFCLRKYSTFALFMMIKTWAFKDQLYDSPKWILA